MHWLLHAQDHLPIPCPISCHLYVVASCQGPCLLESVKASVPEAIYGVAINISNRSFSLSLASMGFLRGNGTKVTLLFPCGAISVTDPRPPTPGWALSAGSAAQQEGGDILHWTWPPEDTTGALPGQLVKIWQKNI